MGVNQFGDLERCALRPGNVHSADGWKDVLDPTVASYRGTYSSIYFRADAGLAAGLFLMQGMELSRIKSEHGVTTLWGTIQKQWTRFLERWP